MSAVSCFFLQNFRNSMYVAFVKGDLEAYLFFGGIRALVRSIRWILIDFRYQRRRGTRSTYGLLIRMGHTIFLLFLIVKLIINNFVNFF